MNHFQPIPYSL